MQRTPTWQPRVAAQTSSSGSHHERVADPRCTAVASCSIGGCDPSSVTTASLSICCAVHVYTVRCVARLARDAKNTEYASSVIWSNGHDTQFWIWWREFEPRRVHVYIYFQLVFSIFFLYYVRNSDTTDNRQRTSSAGCVLNQLAATLYTPAACPQSRKQHHTRAVVCPRCITAVASCLVLGLDIGPCDQ